MHAELWQCINDIVERIGRLGGCRKFKLCVLSGLFLLIVIYEGCAWPSDWDFLRYFLISFVLWQHAD